MPHRRTKRTTRPVKSAVPVRRREFTVRQLKYKKFRLQGMSQYDAAIAAGYSPATATQACKTEAIVKSSMIQELDRAGATDKAIARELARIALDAKKPVACSVLVSENATGKLQVQERLITEVEDNPTRIKALELASRLKKHLHENPFMAQVQQTHLTVVLGTEHDAPTHLPPDGQTDLRVSLVEQS